MKIKSKVLSKFLEKAIVDSKSIPNCMIEPIPEGLRICSMSTDNVMASLGELSKKAVIDNIDIPNLPIRDTQRLMNVMTLFEGDIFLKVEGNILKIYDEDRDIDIVLAEEDFVENRIPLDKFPELEGLKTSFKMPTDVLKKLIKNVDFLKSNSVTVEIKDNQLSLSTGDEHFDKITEKVKVSYQNVKARFGLVLLEIIKSLGKEVEISLGTGYPIRFKEVSDEMETTTVLAPLVDDDEEGTEEEVEDEKPDTNESNTNKETSPM